MQTLQLQRQKCLQRMTGGERERKQKTTRERERETDAALVTSINGIQIHTDREEEERISVHYEKSPCSLAYSSITREGSRQA